MPGCCTISHFFSCNVFCEDLFTAGSVADLVEHQPSIERELCRWPFEQEEGVDRGQTPTQCCRPSSLSTITWPHLIQWSWCHDLVQSHSWRHSLQSRAACSISIFENAWSVFNYSPVQRLTLSALLTCLFPQISKTAERYRRSSGICMMQWTATRIDIESSEIHYCHVNNRGCNTASNKMGKW